MGCTLWFSPVRPALIIFEILPVHYSFKNVPKFSSIILLCLLCQRNRHRPATCVVEKLIKQVCSVAGRLNKSGGAQRRSIRGSVVHSFN